MNGNTKEMTINELLELVNGKLKEGSSITRIEKELKMGKDTLRKKLNRSNYIYDKTDKQFKWNNTGIIKETKAIESNTATTTSNNNNGIIKEYQPKYIAKEVKPSKIQNDLTKSDIDAIKELLLIRNELVELVKTTRNNKGVNIIDAMSFNKANRKKATFNLDLELLEKLKQYEQCNNISKSDIVNIAIRNYLINEGLLNQ
ncbi:hypothetical protein [Clostridium ihumii]|uniref:hypothetical protein n=1 Tax=Clostridium ihumii TaxID=1470356 RepID=UPI00058B6F56|nr:hypothetical protein [Clostridium ihumii]